MVSKELANENKVVDTSLSKAQYDNVENLDSQFSHIFTYFSHFSFFPHFYFRIFISSIFCFFLIIVNPFFFFCFSRH